jgi:hypothetical protein
MNQKFVETKVTENTSIIMEVQSPTRINTFTVWTDAEETFCTMPITHNNMAEAEARVAKLINKFATFA